jgi:23S rRNA C2498 (ribose-2'-O)-methylase RlmM
MTEAYEEVIEKLHELKGSLDDADLENVIYEIKKIQKDREEPEVDWYGVHHKGLPIKLYPYK